MIQVFKTHVIEDEKEREAALDVIAQREGYYCALFAGMPRPPEIAVRYEGARPLCIQIKFMPVGDKPVIITSQSYLSADAATKHAFKKLRRVAKNYFVKTKKRHRDCN